MRKQFNLWKKICDGAMALVTIGTTLLSGVEVQAKTSEAHLEAEQVPLQAESKKICVISDTVSYTHLICVLSGNFPVLLAGLLLAGFASGADLPISLTVISHDAPDEKKMCIRDRYHTLVDKRKRFAGYLNGYLAEINRV